jgi:asparagine synthase (glutamine-hydrolysing)
MVEAARWRGPDGVGLHVDGQVGLGYLSQHVTPESVREVQPLVVGDVVVVADARIDNRRELGSWLGRKAAECTDVELILAAYREWGVECAARLVGDFAFVVWDGGRRRLFGARDALGMRSLVYRAEAGRTLFATEVKQILAVPGVPARIYEPAVGVYLSGPYMPPEWTFYEGIERLGPAHALVVEGGEKRVWRYWDVDPGHRIRYRREEEYAEHFLEVFREAVRARLRSVHPVGLLLSGGVDSGSVAAVAGSLVKSGEAECPEFRAYSFAFEELTECDERAVSGPLAAHWGIPVTDVPADDLWPLKDYPEHGPDRDDPYLFVYQPLLDACLDAARADGCATLLSGDRGDEVVGDWIYDETGLFLAGRWGTLARELKAAPEGKRRRLHRSLRSDVLGPLLGRWMPTISSSGAGVERPTIPPWVRRDFASRVDLESILAGAAHLTAHQASPHVRRRERITNPAATWRALGEERRRARQGTVYCDPWSDRRVTEYVNAIPQHEVNRRSEEKRLARRATRALIPSRIRARLGKTEPDALFDRGFRDTGLAVARELLDDPLVARRGFVDADGLRSSYDLFLRGEPVRYDFWWPLTLEMWLRAHWK